MNGMAKTIATLLLLIPPSLSVTGCAGMMNSLVPDVYLVDRHTIMEADAAGDWPALEQRLRADVNQGPQPFASIDVQQDRQSAFRVLNDEYAPAVSSASSAQ